MANSKQPRGDERERESVERVEREVVFAVGERLGRRGPGLGTEGKARLEQLPARPDGRKRLPLPGGGRNKPERLDGDSDSASSSAARRQVHRA